MSLWRYFGSVIWRRLCVMERSDAESDRIAYRHQCRTANKIINQARRDHNSQHINSCTDSKSRWAAVRELLHSSDNRRFTSDEENLKLCDNFSNFFSIKISNLKQCIKKHIKHKATKHNTKRHIKHKATKHNIKIIGSCPILQNLTFK